MLHALARRPGTAAPATVRLSVAGWLAAGWLAAGVADAAGLRTAHLTAVLVALTLMFRPAANAYFHRPRRLPL